MLSLNTDVYIEIFSYLDGKNILSITSTCHDMHRLRKSEKMERSCVWSEYVSVLRPQHTPMMFTVKTEWKLDLDPSLYHATYVQDYVFTSMDLYYANLKSLDIVFVKNEIILKASSVPKLEKLSVRTRMVRKNEIGSIALCGYFKCLKHMDIKNHIINTKNFYFDIDQLTFNLRNSKPIVF